MEKKTRTLAQIAQEAMDMQNACNPLGLSKGYATALSNLHDALHEAGLPNHTEIICNHPVNVLWLSKLSDLAHMQDMGMDAMDKFGKAWDECKKLATEAV